MQHVWHQLLVAVLNDRGHAREDHSDGHLKADRIVLATSSRHAASYNEVPVR